MDAYPDITLEVVPAYAGESILWNPYGCDVLEWKPLETVFAVRQNADRPAMPRHKRMVRDALKRRATCR